MKTLQEHLEALMRRSQGIERAIILSSHGEILAKTGSYFAPDSDQMEFVADVLEHLKLATNYLEYDNANRIILGGDMLTFTHLPIMSIDCLDATLIIWLHQGAKSGLVALDAERIIEEMCQPV